MNYTFDLSLDDHMQTAGQNRFYDTANSNGFDELNETNDQVDNLLEELNDMVCH